MLRCLYQVKKLSSHVCDRGIHFCFVSMIMLLLDFGTVQIFLFDYLMVFKQGRRGGEFPPVAKTLSNLVEVIESLTTSF